MKCEPTQVLLDTVSHLLAKVKAFKDRAREANKNDAGFRESRLVEETKEILGKEPT
jgi:hypothetical protein